MAVWILIAELIAGAILILSQSWDITIGKILGTFLIIAIVLLIGVNNFIRMEKGEKLVQGFALASFVANLVWMVLAILLLWEVIPATWSEEVVRACTYSRYCRDYVTYEHHVTIAAKLALVGLSIAAAGFWISNVLAIKETIKLVKPLKITAVACEAYCCLYTIVITFGEIDIFDSGAERWAALSGLAGFAFVVTALAAWIISLTNRKHDREMSAKSSKVEGGAVIAKTEAELRAEIEEKVRREMIEKEVRERIEAEQRVAQVKKDVTAEEIIKMDHEVKS